MSAAANMVELAALVGDTARATMLALLMGGQSLTSSELAAVAGVSRGTASLHLKKLTESCLITGHRVGRHTYYRISSVLVARMLETMIAVAAIELPARYSPRSVRDEALRAARTCYDHLAGAIGVAMSDKLVALGYVELDDEGGEVTASGIDFFRRWGIDLESCQSRSNRTRVFCRPCLDWSERRYHIGGLLGAKICKQCFEAGWFERLPGTRALLVTESGHTGLYELLGLDCAVSVSVNGSSAELQAPPKQVA